MKTVKMQPVPTHDPDTEDEDSLIISHTHTTDIRTRGRFSALKVHTTWLALVLCLVLTFCKLTDWSQTHSLSRPEKKAVHRNWLNWAKLYFGWQEALQLLISAVFEVLAGDDECVVVWLVVGLMTLPRIEGTTSTKHYFARLRGLLPRAFVLVVLAHTAVVLLNFYLTISLGLRMNMGGKLNKELVILALKRPRYIWQDGVGTTTKHAELLLGLFILGMLSPNLVPSLILKRCAPTKPRTARLKRVRKALFFVAAVSVVFWVLGIAPAAVRAEREMMQVVHRVEQEYRKNPDVCKELTTEEMGCVLKREQRHRHNQGRLDSAPTETESSSEEANLEIETDSPQPEVPSLIALVFWESAGLRAALGKPGVAPFLQYVVSSKTSQHTKPEEWSHLLKDHVTMSFSRSFPTIPNTKKCMVEMLCGFDAHLTPDWRDFETIQKRECLPDILRRNQGYKSVVFSAAALGGLLEISDDSPFSGFDDVYDADYFADNHGVKKTNKDCIAEDDMIPHILEYVQRFNASPNKADNKPIFMFLGMCSTHSPYMSPVHRFGSNPSQLYLSSIFVTDMFFSSLMTSLSQTVPDVYRTSSFIISGDHGEAFGEHRHYSHGSCVYTECTRVPTVVFHSKQLYQGWPTPTPFPSPPSYPLVPVGEFEHEVSRGPNCPLGNFRRLADIFATVLELGGITINKHTLGKMWWLRPGKSLLSTCGHRTLFVHSFLNPASVAVHMPSADGSWVEAVFDLHLTGRHIFNMTADPQQREAGRGEVIVSKKTWEPWLRKAILRRVCCGSALGGH